MPTSKLQTGTCGVRLDGDYVTRPSAFLIFGSGIWLNPVDRLRPQINRRWSARTLGSTQSATEPSGGDRFRGSPAESPPRPRRTNTGWARSCDCGMRAVRLSEQPEYPLDRSAPSLFDRARRSAGSRYVLKLHRKPPRTDDCHGNSDAGRQIHLVETCGISGIRARRLPSQQSTRSPEYPKQL